MFDSVPTKETDGFTEQDLIDYVLENLITKMRYIIVTIEWCMEHGIVPPIHARRSVDGTMILLHEDFVAPVLGDEEISSYLYDSNELSEILNSEVWNNSLTQEENQNI